MANMLVTGQGMCRAPGSIFLTLCQVSTSCLEGAGVLSGGLEVLGSALQSALKWFGDLLPYPVGHEACSPVSVTFLLCPCVQFTLTTA